MIALKDCYLKSTKYCFMCTRILNTIICFKNVTLLMHVINSLYLLRSEDMIPESQLIYFDTSKPPICIFETFSNNNPTISRLHFIFKFSPFWVSVCLNTIYINSGFLTFVIQHQMEPSLWGLSNWESTSINVIYNWAEIW